ncbi:MAG: YihY/virulence factor BrkB family protein [bacterium]|nr:YihY/virulence factor BrkB family protein [bacterium]
MEQVRNFFKKVVELIKQPEMRILPGNLAFFFVMSLIPIVALVGAIASKFSISFEIIKSGIDITIPGAVGDFISSIVNGQGLTFNIGVFFISAFLLASNGTHSIIIASNEIYKIKQKDYLTRRIKAVLMTLILVEAIFILLAIPVFGDSIFTFLRNHLNNQNSINFFYRIYKLLKYPLTLIIIYFNVKLIYVIAPDAEIGSKTTTKGALFTTVSWLIASEVYSFYLDTFTKYDLFYGSVSNLLILLLWVYALSYIFVLGLVINAGVYKNQNKEQEKN